MITRTGEALAKRPRLEPSDIQAAQSHARPQTMLEAWGSDAAGSAHCEPLKLVKQEADAPAAGATISPQSGYLLSLQATQNLDSDAQPEVDANPRVMPSAVSDFGLTNIPVAGLSQPVPNPEPTPDLDPTACANNIVEQHVLAESDQGAALSPPQAPVTPPPPPSPPLPSQQTVPQLILQLDGNIARSRQMSFAAHSPASATVKLWRSNQQNVAMYSLSLVGNARTPEEYVGIDPKDLIIHSRWAAGMYDRAGAASIWHARRTTVPLPIETPVDIVYTMVEALYRGSITLRHDNVEHLLLLSHAMQVSLVQKRCRRYLLTLDRHLPLEQLQQLCLLWDRLAMCVALKHTLRSLMNRPWLSDVVQTVSKVFRHLLPADAAHLQIAVEVLQADACGRMCELQVLDMLLAAGLTLDNPLLPTLFRIGRIADKAFALLENAIKPDTLPLPSSKLLISVASRAAKFSSWSDACNMPQEILSMNMPSSRLSRTELMFGVQGFLFKVDIPKDGIAPEEGSVDSTAEYKLSLISSCRMPANVTTMVLYCFTKNVPMVRTICQWDIRAAAEPVWRAKPVWTAKCCPAKSSAVKHQMSEGHVTGFGLRANNV